LLLGGRDGRDGLSTRGDIKDQERRRGHGRFERGGAKLQGLIRDWVGLLHDSVRAPQSSDSRTAKKASWGISTWPTCFIRFLPAACLAQSLRLRVIPPP